MRATSAGLVLLPLLLAVFVSSAGASLGAPGGDGDPDIPQACVEPIRLPHPHPTAGSAAVDDVRSTPGTPSLEGPRERVGAGRIPVSKGCSWMAWLCWLQAWTIR